LGISQPNVLAWTWSRLLRTAYQSSVLQDSDPPLTVSHRPACMGHHPPTAKSRLLPVIYTASGRRFIWCLPCKLAACVAEMRRSCRGGSRDALEGKGPQRRPQKPLHGRLEEVAEAAGGGSCRLSMPLRLAVWETVAGHRLGTLVSGEGGAPPLSNASLGGSRSCATTGQSCSSPCAKLFVNAKAKPIPIV
jgi:hypothetical protein